MNAFSREPGTQDVPGECKWDANGETEVRGIATAKGTQKAEGAPPVPGLGLFNYMLSLPLGSVLRDSQPSPCPGKGCSRREGGET